MPHNSYWNNHAFTKRPINIHTRKSWFTITGNSRQPIKKPSRSIVHHLNQRSKKLNMMSNQELKYKLNHNLQGLRPSYSPEQNPLLKFKNSRENLLTKKRKPNPLTRKRMAHLQNKNPEEYARLTQFLEKENPKSIRKSRPNPLTRKRMAYLQNKNPEEYARLTQYLEREKS